MKLCAIEPKELEEKLLIRFADNQNDELLEDLSDYLINSQKEIERLNNKHNKALEKINDYKIYCKKNKGFTEYTDIEIEAIEPVISKLEDILKEEK